MGKNLANGLYLGHMATAIRRCRPVVLAAEGASAGAPDPGLVDVLLDDAGVAAVVPPAAVPALSEAVARSIDVGATGAVASMVTVSDVDAELRLLAPSNAVAVKVCAPSASTPVVIDHVPVELVGGAPSAICPDVTVVPTRVAPS